MNRTAKNIAIEKNRTALLRLVRCWLMITAMLSANRVLPRRIGQWVSRIIFKVEKAAYYLQIASGFMQATGSLPVEQHGQITIKAVINRLRSVKRLLIRLKPSAGHWLRLCPNFTPNNYPQTSVFYSGGGLRKFAAFNGRAPPCLDAAHYTF
ncbi:hypothetical protein WNY59_07510 [Ahrensia kielensis]|uniref:Transposase n=1 Tax=Ahrensia kielensis TaxID=76980 RepID=A0ABU9T6P1_9HYPH